MFESITGLLGLSSAADAAGKLEKLRSDPERAATEYGFVVDVGGMVDANRTEGGPCTIECAALGNGNYVLRPRVGSGRDYYFPYVSQGLGGVGQCRVPCDAAEGTIVITGGMNGCSLDVRRAGGELVFTHDANGVSMSALPAGDGRRDGKGLCRVDARQYMVGPFQQNRAASIMAASTGTNGAMPLNFLITVRSGGRWKVVHSAMMQVVTQSGGSTSEEFERQRVMSNLVTTFDG
ncbi:MAG TPA: hypothetical protein VE650_21205 [Acetobacteraceae bacterium]|nr:hypothetical protein [Acetobacteraceae bacterium]